MTHNFQDTINVEDEKENPNYRAEHLADVLNGQTEQENEDDKEELEQPDMVELPSMY